MDILSGIFVIIGLTTYILKFNKRQLRRVSSFVYITGMMAIIFVVYNNKFNREAIFLLLMSYGLYCFSLSSTKAFFKVNTVLLSIIFIAILFLEFETIVPFGFIVVSIFTLGLAGYSITAARNYYRRKLENREKVLNIMFNHSSEGLILIERENMRVFEANEKAIEILGIENQKEIILEQIEINGINIFQNTKEEKRRTIELKDQRLLSILTKEVNIFEKEYCLVELTEYKNRQELSIVQEFDNLKSITAESYDSIFNSGASFMCVIDIKDKIIDINKEFLDFLGFKKEEIVGSKYYVLDYKNYNEERKIINKKAWSGETQLFEKEIVSREGNVIFIEVILRKAKYFGEDVLISNSRDISQRKLLQKIADYNFDQYSTLFKESPIALVISDLDGDIIEINDSFEKMLGYERKEILGRNISVFSNDVDMEKNLDLRKKLINQEIPFLEMQKRYITRSGSLVHTLLKIIIQKDEEDIPSKFLAQIVDITEFVKAEGKIKESEKSYRDVFNNSFELLYILNRKNEFIDVNQAVIIEYGHEKNEILGKQPDFFSAEGKNDLDEVISKIDLAWDGKDQQILWWSLRKDGSIFPKDLHLRKGIYFGEEVLMCSGRNISDEFEYEQQLIKSEKKYKDLIHQSIFGILIFQEDRVVFANNKAVNLLKYKTSSSLIGKNREAIIQTKDIGDIEKRVLDLKEGNEVLLKEFELLAADGSFVFVESKPSIIEYEGEECILSSFVDISDRKKAEFAQQKIKEAKSVNETLKEQLEQNRLIQRRLQNAQSYSEGIIESSLDMIFTTDIKGNITKLNSAAKKELQISKKEYLKKPFEIVLKNKDQGEQIIEELNKKNEFSGEIEMQRKDGSHFPAFLSISYLFNTEGSFLGIMGVSRDISEIISKEGEIKEQASKLTSIIESSSHFFFTVNKNLRITSFNELFRKDVKDKLDCEIELYDDFFKLFHDRENSSQVKLKKFWEEKFGATFNGKSIYFEIDRVSKDGMPFFREIHMNPIYSQNGEIEEVSAISHDTTEKKLNEIKLKNSLNEKEILLKEVHHRVKNNMQVISSILNLQSANVTDESILTVLRESQSRIQAMASIHERLYRTKNFSDIRFSVYVRNLVESLVHTYDLSENKVKLSFKLDEVYLTLNAAIPCGLIINELISNSLKYAFVGKEKVKLKLNCIKRREK